MKKSPDIIWYDTIDSTNDEARRRISELDNLSVIAAIRQTAGRGQGDHKWHSREGENLTFSAVLKFGTPSALAPLDARDAIVITQIVTGALRRFLLGKGINARIKWPNDIYVGDKKICGILIENILSGKEVSSSVIGIGLNVNQLQFPQDLPNPVSMAQLTSEQYDIKAVLEEFCAQLRRSALRSNTPAGRESLSKDFYKHMFKLPGETREI